MASNTIRTIVAVCCILPWVPQVFNAAEDAPHEGVAIMRHMATVYGLPLREDGPGVRLVLPDGKTIPYQDDRILAGHPWAIPDIRGLFRQPYPGTNVRFGIRDRERDPGRYRNYQLLGAVYGASQAEVRRLLTSVDFCGTRVLFSTRNGAAAALARVSDEIRKRPLLLAWIRQLVGRDSQAIGTWCWRTIAGTGNLSPHSYGIAIDIYDRRSPRISYWRFVSPDPQKASRWPELVSHERIWQPPQELVYCFEKHGFVWGGKWYHFDPMHFEYRPEFFGLEAVREP